MSEQTATRTVGAAEVSLSFLRHAFEGYPRDFAVRLWDGSRWEAEPGQPERFTFVLRHPGALRACFLPAKALTLCEAYLRDDFDVEGDLDAFWGLVDHLYRPAVARSKFGRRDLEARLAALPEVARPPAQRPAAQMRGSLHTQSRDRQAIASHYDVSNDFYALWLDSRMVYSCAYFKSPDDDLEAAQRQKLDHICRKLRLRPGERLLDIGCGWGGLALYAAGHYGVEVLGVTLSAAQAEWANDRIRAAGLAGRCRVEHRDYREVDEPEGFDKVVSVGMMEHVGEEMLPSYFRRAWGLLRPGGVFLNHAISGHSTNPIPPGATFMGLYVFPDGELEPLPTILQAAEGAGFEVRDVENLREHYRLTLQHWVRRLEARADEARRLTDEVRYRIWRLYLSWCAYGFKGGLPTIYQALLVKAHGGESGLPLTRADWYAAA
jgi:cyclopropane-fatty-acyl-phospholipid synthase